MVSELESRLSHDIAQLDGIRPEDVTVAYIHEQREKKIYPTTKFDIGSDYSAYGTGLKFYTLEQLDFIEKLVDELLEKI